MDPILALLVSPDETLSASAVAFFTEIVSNYPRFLTEVHYDSLAAFFESDAAQQRYAELIGGEALGDAVPFGLFMLAYGEAKLGDMLPPRDERLHKFLGGLCGLLAAEGYPVVEDQIFVPALEFWSNFAEAMWDALPEEGGEMPGWLPPTLAFLRQVVLSCWRKIQYPSVETFMGWDSAERLEFGDARKDVADLLGTIYSVYDLTRKQQLLRLFVDLLLEGIPTRAWAEIEAAAFCLAALSDSISDDRACDGQLQRLFSEPLFGLLGLGEAYIPVRLRQTALSLVERYSDYFERHPQHLPAALGLLFDAVGSAGLGGSSSKSIATLCSSCRRILTGEVGAFLGHYQTLHAREDLDPLAEERIVAAISSIVQAIPDESQRLQAFAHLLSFVLSDVEGCLRLQAEPLSIPPSQPFVLKAVRQCHPARDGEMPPAADVLAQAALHALRRLASMARGMQAAHEMVDLEAQEAATTSQGSEPLAALQKQIAELLIRVQDAFPASGEIVEAICNILKAGFAESEPGPFVFPPDMATALLTRQGPKTPQIGVAVTTACAFVSSVGKGPKSLVAPTLARLLPWVVSLLRSLPGLLPPPPPRGPATPRLTVSQHLTLTRTLPRAASSLRHAS